MIRRAPAALALIALIAGGCVGFSTESSAPIDVLAPGTWTTLAPMPTARQEVAVVALDNRVYVIGGFGPGGEPVATVEVYDPAANRWEARAPLPVALHHPAAAVAAGRLLVIGGYTGGRISWTASDAVLQYDADKNTWTTRAPMSAPRGALAVAVLNDRVHAVGGSAKQVSQMHEVYDPATNQWALAAPMPTARDHLAAVAFQGRLWALGGRTSFMGTQYSTVEVYDPSTDGWSSAAPLPDGRGGLAAVALSDRILVFGGEKPFRIFNATEMYEVAGSRWIGKTPMPTPRHGIGAAAVAGRVYVPGGGREPGFAATDVNEAYAP
jgi:N-acetylneuraminic acid mutarotase